MTQLRNRLTASAAVVLTLIGSLLVSAVPAQAATARNGVCESGEFCYYYNSNNAGSISDMSYSLGNYGTDLATCNHFVGAGNGKGQCIKNNAASAWNQTGETVRVYFNSGFVGDYQDFAPGERANLNTKLKNNNASHKIGVTTVGPTWGTPNVNPHPSATGRAPAATARTQFVDNEIARLTGEKDCWVGGYRSYQPSTSNHNTGNALDCEISNSIGTYPSATQKAQGTKLANWLQTHASRLQVRYVIWDGKIWSVARSSEGWRDYTVARDVTGGHFDHVHVSVQNPQGD